MRRAKMNDFEDVRFRARVASALAKAKTVLDVSRNPQLPSDVPHRYQDKYVLAECVVNMGVASAVAVLQALGLTAPVLKRALDWHKQGLSVTLRLKAEHRCVFDREVKREEEGNTEVVTKLVGVFKRVDKVITTIVEWFWIFSVEYDLVIFPGANVADGVRLQGNVGKCEMKTLKNETPRPERTVLDGKDLNLTWLLNSIDATQLGSSFSIARGHKDCHTPRRNQDVNRAVAFFREVRSWGSSVANYFLQDLFEAQQPHGLDVSSINVSALFVPVVPLLEPKKKSAGPPAAVEKMASASAVSPSKSPRVIKTGETGGFGLLRSSLKHPDQGGPLVPYVAPAAAAESPLLAEEDLDILLNEHQRTLSEKIAALGKVFPSAGVKVVTVAEAVLALGALHLAQLTEAVFDGVDFIEEMLRKQIVAAIGKEVQPMDFAQYMLFHNRKLFKEEYRPKPLSFAVRRPNYCPEGIVSIDAQMADGSLADPIQTLCSKRQLVKPYSFPIDASTNVSFKGDLYVHGWLGHQFSGESGLSLSLNARARQFSSFVLLVGRIVGTGLFDPSCALIVKDKDDIRIPLLLETIPSAKEFKEAISSLSDEQQRFAKAYRGMQLASTLFAVCVIQIKPQLERVLKIPADSLTKQIELTQNLQELFLKYQIPSDLLSYDYTDGRPKVPAVMANVGTMMKMIEETKVKEMKEAVAVRKVAEAAAFVQDEIEELEEKEEEADELPLPRHYKSKGGGGGGGLLAKFGSFFKSSSSAKSSAAPSIEESGAMREMSLGAAPAQTESNAQEIVAVAPTNNQSEPKKEEPKKTPAAPEGSEGDVSLMPKLIESQLERYDEEGAVRPTIINLGLEFKKKSQANILADLTESVLSTEDQRLEKQKAFDLLDALTRSGGLCVEDAALHVVLAASHCFDKSVINTLVQDNVNPIERVERSTLIIAGAVHGVENFDELVKPAELARVRTYSSNLFK